MPDRLEETDWERLFDRVKIGKCTPFLGSGVCCEEIPNSSQIANEWAKKYGYPMEDSYDLMRVAQFVAVTEDPMTPKEKICKEINEQLKEITPKYFETSNETHGVLADLQLPVYITTNYDDLMERALKSRDKTPIQEICRWNKYLKRRNPMSFEYDPTPANPLVYHLHGCYEIPESLVLTEDDYLEFLIAISREQDLLPPRIQEAFTGASLLFLGYRIADWDFRVLFRILADYLERDKCRRKHMSVQLVPGSVSKTQKEEAQEYLDRYFAELNIQVYWQDCREFAAELKRRWEAFNRGTIKKDTDSMNEITRNLEPAKTVPSPANKNWFEKEFGISCQNKEETNMVSILFLAADPTDATRLRLGEEFREIQEKLKLSKFRDRFRLQLPQLSVRPSDITQALLDTQPQIVHFSGHGTSTGELCFENLVGKSHPIEPEALAELFEQFSENINCVILNACYSETQAKAIAKHIKYVIGMSQEIGDEAAIAFTIGFYQALGGGCSTKEAYRLGCVQIRLQNIPGHLKPVLINKDSSTIINAQL
jgi:hypothetical protein